MSKRRAHGEGSIYQRKDGLWAAQIPLPSGKRKYKYAKTQKEAKDWLQKEQRAIADGLMVVDEKVTLGDFLDRWFEDVAKPLLRPSTVAVHETIIRLHIKPEIGHLRLVRLTPVHLQTLYSKKLKAGLSKRTVKYIHTVIHRALDQALKWGLVARNVAEAVDAPKPDKKQVEPLTPVQVGKLFEVLKFDRLFPLYVTAVGCGLRRGNFWP